VLRRLPRSENGYKEGWRYALAEITEMKQQFSAPMDERKRKKSIFSKKEDKNKDKEDKNKDKAKDKNKTVAPVLLRRS